MEKIFLINERNEECVPLIDQSASVDFVKYNVPTDGTSNAATALQSVFDNSNGLVIFPKGTYVLNASLTVDTSKVKMIVGNGATLKVTGNFPALIVQGNPSSNNWTADPEMPVNKAAALAAAKIPVLLVYGGCDTIVPPKQNCLLFAERFKAAGGELKVIPRDLFGHHPHGLDPDKTQPIVDFFAK